MAYWTYRFDFDHAGHSYRVESGVGLQVQQSRVYRDGSLIEQQALLFSAGYSNPVFLIPLDEDTSTTESSAAGTDILRIELGYRNWFSLVARASHRGVTVFDSHPGADISHAEESTLNKRTNPSPQAEQEAREALQRWERNKYSIFADIGLGALFFIVGKLTGNLTLAALVGAGAGLSLVLAQRYVSVDLLGGFAVFGTIMLLISAGFSLAFQSDYMVQMKSTVLGVLTATLFFGDGLLRKGKYFGQRLQRYMPAPIDTGRMALALGLTGLVMALNNYLVARFMSESAWLTYTTFLDTPLSIAMAYASFYWARADVEEGT